MTLKIEWSHEGGNGHITEPTLLFAILYGINSLRIGIFRASPSLPRFCSGFRTIETSRSRTVLVETPERVAR